MILAIVIAVAAFVTLAYQNHHHAKLVRELCQRLQAPQTATAQYAVMQMPATSTTHLPYDDDDAFQKYVETLSGSTD